MVQDAVQEYRDYVMGNFQECREVAKNKKQALSPSGGLEFEDKIRRLHVLNGDGTTMEISEPRKIEVGLYWRNS